MAKKVKPLSDKQITNTKAPAVLYDGDGLRIELKENGSKLWRFEYKSPVLNKKRLISFGAYPIVTLELARQKRMEARSLIHKRIDPKNYWDEQADLEQKKAEWTFRLVAEKWKLDKESSDVIKDLTISKNWRIIENHLMPKLGNFPIDDIIPKAVKPVIDIPYNEGKPEIVRKSARLLNEILDHAVNSLFVIDINPCKDILKAFGNLKRGTNPAIKPDQLSEFFDRLENSDVNLLTKYLIQWQLLTMVRPNEAVTAEWSDIDINQKLWIIPAEKMKQTKTSSDKPHLVPLSSQSLELLKRIRRLNRNSAFIFPSVRSGNGHINRETANNAIRDDMGYRGKQTAHGLRKIASTYLHEAEVMPDVIEMCLSHTIGGIRGVYNNAQYLEQRKEALQKWGDYVEECKKRAGYIKVDN